jgi:hypothetical protein
MKTTEQRLANALVKLEADRCIAPLEDGFYCFFPPVGGGCFDPWLLRAIADRLDQLNAPLQKEFDEVKNA